MKAYAKINFGLKIFKKNKGNALHDIDSIFFLTKKYFDRIKIKKSKKLSIKYFSKNKENEIVFKNCILEKTIKYLEQKYHTKIFYRIEIIKMIPQQSGLGGASSDAAVLINYFVKNNTNIVLDLYEIAHKIGSDVPFFISKFKKARVKNFGAFIVPINKKICPKYDIFLTKVTCSAKQVYDLLDQDNNYCSNVNIDLIIDGLINTINVDTNNINDLSKYIVMLEPKLKNKLLTCQNSFFTGSGGTIIILRGNNYEQN